MIYFIHQTSLPSNSLTCYFTNQYDKGFKPTGIKDSKNPTSCGRVNDGRCEGFRLPLYTEKLMMALHKLPTYTLRVR